MYDAELASLFHKLGVGKTWLEWWRKQMKGVHFQMLFSNVFQKNTDPEALDNNPIEGLFSLMKNVFKIKQLKIDDAVPQLLRFVDHYQAMVRIRYLLSRCIYLSSLDGEESINTM